MPIWPRLTQKPIYSSSELYNGKGDAYRHALWNAFAAAKIGADLTKQLTTAHENQPSRYAYNYKENEMDFFNNQVGRDLGSESLYMLMTKVKSASDSGKLRYLSNLDPANKEATKNSNLIPTNQ